jgi:tRNA A-37 threonylcarbamoyl transferase component Bud32/tetratricopeptide (TPR) repeat protein
MPLSAGNRLGNYEILASIGAGGMGEVYRAKDTKLGRQVAIKVLPAHLAADASARERLRLEAVAAAALDHPFICKVFEIGEDHEVLFLAMEFIAGDTLHHLLCSRLRSGRMPLPEALRIAGEVAEALEEAHNQRFLHRDLKPANIMFAHGHVKVMDFGLAKQFGNRAQSGDDAATATIASPALTELGAAIGTPDYMSPEQVKGEPLDQRSDLFSFGILLCDLLGGPHPFRRASTTETLAAILRDPPNLSGGLPQGLMVLIRRLLAKSRDDRYPSMVEVRADLARLSTSSEAASTVAAEERIPLIGREQEFAELNRWLEEALAGRGSLVMVGGEPGIGKTHLTAALLEAAKRRGAFAVIGHCYEMEGAQPYVPFIEMLEYSARTAPRESFRYVLGDDAPEVAKLMPELRVMYPDMPAAIQLPPEQQRRFLFNAYRAFVERSARLTPIVAVFEDLHWADEPTLLLLQHVAQTLSTTPMLLIGTYRDVELEVTRPFAQMLETLLRQKQAARISLRRLAVGGVESMLAAMSGQKPPPSLARVVFEETEGNPFFVEEVFRHLSEEGKLFDEAGQWRPGLRVDQLQVPEGVRLVLGRRLDRLGGDARRILTTAAVIGRSFSLRLLEELENQHADAALDAIEEAERAHLVSAEPAGRDTRYRFVHELVRQTLSETLSLPRRQRLHARVAEAIERVYAPNLEVQASPLAHHLYQAGAAADPEKTTTYLVLAAKRARASAAHEEALAHLENALSLWEGEQSVRVAELTEQRAAALGRVGRRDEAVVCYRMAVALFENAGAVTKAAGTSLILARAQGLELAAVHRTIDRALDCLGSADPQLRMSLLTMRAASMSAGGDASGAADLLAEVKAQRKTAGGLPLSAFDEGAEMYCLATSMRFEEMLATARRVSESERVAGNLWGAADTERLVGYELFCGRTAEAARRLPAAMLLANRVGHYGAVWVTRFLWATLSLSRGDLIAAEREMEEARSFGEAHQVPWTCVFNPVELGMVAFLRGNLTVAERWLSKRPEVEGQTFLSGWRDACLFAFRAESEQDAESSNAQKAWTDRSWKLPLIGQPNPWGAWLALERSVIGLAWLGKREEAAALRPLTEELLQTGVWVSLDLSPFRTAAGIAAACAGDWSAAEQHHLTAIHQTDTAPYRVSQPMAREWYATMLLDRNAPGDAAKARGLFSEALAMYESVGMPFHASRAGGRLAAL